MGRDSLTFFRSYFEAAAMLPPERYKAFVGQVAAYAFDDVEPSFGAGSLEAMAFLLIRPNIDKSKLYKQSGAKGGAKRGLKGGLEGVYPKDKDKDKDKDMALEEDQDQDKDKALDNKGRKHYVFTPPTIIDIQAYCDERHNGIDAQYFYDYYQARGWELKKGQKVRDWKACVRTWEKNMKKPREEVQKRVYEEWSED